MILQDEVYGLILAGGKSSRMKTDKGELAYHNQIKQRTFLYNMLKEFCGHTFISCRQDQVVLLQEDQEHIIDEDLYGGPLNGVLSAHHKYPDKAWLVLAVDLPHITTQTIIELLQQRDASKTAVAYHVHGSTMPEPLIAIWEPKGLDEAEKYIHQGSNCPRKFLSSRDTKMILPGDDRELFNANSYTDYLEAKSRLETHE